MLSEVNATHAAAQFIETIAPFPDRFSGRGIVTCAGAIQYNTCAWVLIHMLRSLGCKLPIEVWYLGDRERDERWIELVEPLGVRCIDAVEVAQQYPHPRLRGWELKPFAILHSAFEEVLFLDADNVPVVNPTFLFDTAQYHETGTIFWPDTVRARRESLAWQVFGVAFGDEWEIESGQMVIDKRRVWQALNLCNWYNERSDFFYEYVYGDKDTFRFAWRRLAQPYAMPRSNVKGLSGTYCQLDFQGRRIFQHRCRPKWSLGDVYHVHRFSFEDECIAYLTDLKRRWSPLDLLARDASDRDRAQFNALAGSNFVYTLGREQWPLHLNADGSVHGATRRNLVLWWVEDERLIFATENGPHTCRFLPDAHGHWKLLWHHQNQVAHLTRA